MRILPRLFSAYPKTVPTSDTIVNHFKDLYPDHQEEVVRRIEGNSLRNRLHGIALGLGGLLMSSVPLGIAVSSHPDKELGLTRTEANILAMGLAIPITAMGTKGVSRFQRSEGENAAMGLLAEEAGLLFTNREGEILETVGSKISLDALPQSVRKGVFATIREALVAKASDF